ncbi:MAG: hypothetical protein KDB60_10010 [Propionibacteriaceae bacterium]|nr:hypothetical protein [Propionibacteriaceae bacterium]
MHLLNAAVAVTSAIVGTAGATVAYGSLNAPPVQPNVPEQVTYHVFAPCDPPAVLTEGICVTTVVKTKVKKEKPKVITIVETVPSSSKGSSHSSSKKTTKKHHHEDDREDEHEDHDHEDGDD